MRTADFDWMAYKGGKLKLLLNKHPYADAMIADLANFKSLTGMDVTYDIFPEDVYFDKVTAALSSGSSEYDAFMTGAYMTWTYGPAGWIVDLNEYLKDPAKTNPKHNWEDVLPGLRASTAWNGVPGGDLGERGVGGGDAEPPEGLGRHHGAIGAGIQDQGHGSGATDMGADEDGGTRRVGNPRDRGGRCRSDLVGLVGRDRRGRA